MEPVLNPIGHFFLVGRHRFAPEACSHAHSRFKEGDLLLCCISVTALE